MGFGYDPVSYDYKLVKFHEQYQPDHDYPYRLDIGVIIYSLRTNSWRDIVRFVIADTEYTYEDYYPCFYNGALHRLYTNKILVFDLHKEDFEWFDLPLTYEVHNYYSDHLSVLNESLALIVGWLRVEVGYEIWVMLEYGVRSSWTQLYNIRPDVGINDALSFSNKGEIILKTFKGELASLDVKTMVIKLFNVTRRWVFNPETGQLERALELMDALRYRESFVSLSEVNE